MFLILIGRVLGWINKCHKLKDAFPARIAMIKFAAKSELVRDHPKLRKEYVTIPSTPLLSILIPHELGSHDLATDNLVFPLEKAVAAF